MAMCAQTFSLTYAPICHYIHHTQTRQYIHYTYMHMHTCCRALTSEHLGLSHLTVITGKPLQDQSCPRTLGFSLGFTGVAFIRATWETFRKLCHVLRPLSEGILGTLCYSAIWSFHSDCHNGSGPSLIGFLILYPLSCP